jgi:hypothetical protein
MCKISEPEGPGKYNYTEVKYRENFTELKQSQKNERLRTTFRFFNERGRREKKHFNVDLDRHFPFKNSTGSFILHCNLYLYIFNKAMWNSC